MRQIRCQDSFRAYKVEKLAYSCINNRNGTLNERLDGFRLRKAGKACPTLAYRPYHVFKFNWVMSTKPWHYGYNVSIMNGPSNNGCLRNIFRLHAIPEQAVT